MSLRTQDTLTDYAEVRATAERGLVRLEVRAVGSARPWKPAALHGRCEAAGPALPSQLGGDPPQPWGPACLYRVVKGVPVSIHGLQARPAARCPVGGTQPSLHQAPPA